MFANKGTDNELYQIAIPLRTKDPTLKIHSQSLTFGDSTLKI